MRSSQELESFLAKDRAEVYGNREVPRRYPCTGEGIFRKILVDDEQNELRLKMLIAYLEGALEEVDTAQIPQELRSKCRFVTMTQPSQVLILKVAEKTAIVQTYGEHMFYVDCFLNGKHDGGNHDMSLPELSDWFTRDQQVSPFSPGLA